MSVRSIPYQLLAISLSLITILCLAMLAIKSENPFCFRLNHLKTSLHILSQLNLVKRCPKPIRDKPTSFRHGFENSHSYTYSVLKILIRNERLIIRRLKHNPNDRRTALQVKIRRTSNFHNTTRKNERAAILLRRYTIKHPTCRCDKFGKFPVDLLNVRS